jgi:hypothetical protein
VFLAGDRGVVDVGVPDADWSGFGGWLGGAHGGSSRVLRWS